MPFAYSIHDTQADYQPIGTIICAIPHFTKKQNLFGMPGLPTKWQTLLISRVWIDPNYQHQTTTDRHGKQHSLCVASCAIAQVMRRINRDWLTHHPPRFLDQPYNLRLVLSYADTAFHHFGTMYRASNFTKVDEVLTDNNRRRHGKRQIAEKNQSIKIVFAYRLGHRNDINLGTLSNEVESIPAQSRNLLDPTRQLSLIT